MALSGPHEVRKEHGPHERKAEEVEKPCIGEGVQERHHEAFGVAQGEDHHLKGENVDREVGTASVGLPQLHVVPGDILEREAMRVRFERTVAFPGTRTNLHFTVSGHHHNLVVHAHQHARSDVDVVALELSVGGDGAVGQGVAVEHREADLQDNADAPWHAVGSVRRKFPELARRPRLLGAGERTVEEQGGGSVQAGPHDETAAGGVPADELPAGGVPRFLTLDRESDRGCETSETDTILTGGFF
eukprot:6464536-Prymnesium_polylepis.1